MQRAIFSALCLIALLALVCGYYEHQQEELEKDADYCADAIDTGEPEGAAYCDKLYRLAYGVDSAHE